MRFGIAKRNPQYGSEIDHFKSQINSLFDDFFDVKPTGFADFEWAPAVDVVEDKKGYHIHADLPGLDEKDINVEYENGFLTISGEKKKEREEKSDDERYIFSECSYGSFSRSIRLPEGTDTNKIEAKFKKGVLNIDIPKSGSEKTKKITIGVNK